MQLTFAHSRILVGAARSARHEANETSRFWCRRYSYSAVALNFLTSAVVMLEGIFFIGLVQQMVFGPKRCKPISSGA